MKTVLHVRIPSNEWIKHKAIQDMIKNTAIEMRETISCAAIDQEEFDALKTMHHVKKCEYEVRGEVFVLYYVMFEGRYYKPKKEKSS